MQAVFINKLCIIIIYIGKILSFNTKRIAVLGRKTAFIRTAYRAENCLVFCVVQVQIRTRALYKRVFTVFSQR